MQCKFILKYKHAVTQVKKSNKIQEQKNLTVNKRKQKTNGKTLNPCENIKKKTQHTLYYTNRVIMVQNCTYRVWDTRNVARYLYKSTLCKLTVHQAKYAAASVGLCRRSGNNGYGIVWLGKLSIEDRTM